MKQKFVLFTVLLFAAQLVGFSQDKKNKVKSSRPLIIEEAIRSITISGNIDVVFLQGKQDKETIKVPENTSNKLKVELTGGTIFLSPTKKLAAGERLPVYVTINTLEKLTLKGNAFAISQGMLHSENLQIDMDKEAGISIMSKGIIEVNNPGKYQLSKEREYSYVSTLLNVN